MSIERLIAEKLSKSRNSSTRLNPVLFDEDDKLQPLVREKVLNIVDEFIDYIQVNIKILDIRLVGSNAAYNYTPSSDLDIHIITDLSEISDPEVIARLYFDSVKKNFKDSYDITIKGIEVELYVEDVKTSSVSNGIYSVTKDEWIKEPVEVSNPTNEDFEEAEEIVDKILDEIESSKTAEEIQEIIDKLYIMRKDSLSADGETGAGNLAFKILRSKGTLDELKKLLRSATSRDLSLENKKIKKGI